MMAAWMIYSIASAAALSMAGLLAERELTLLRRPLRWLWLSVMLTSVAWPFASAGLLGPDAAVSAGEAVSTISPPWSGTATAWRMIPASLPVGMPDPLLLAAWCVASSLFLMVLLVSVLALREDARRWRRGVVAGEPVFLSGSVGPAVVGTVRPRVVLPLWVLRFDESLQRLIVLHEREHVRAGDSRLLTSALLLLVLLPWCLPLWWQFHRLRLAIETDCDARLLAAGAPARDYAGLLLSVARRRRDAVLPLNAMALSKAALERRIGLIVAGPPRGRTRTAFTLLATTAVLLALGAAVMPVPQPPSLTMMAAQLRPDSPRPVVAHGLLPDGSLPGDPGDERLYAAIRTHHSDAIASGLPPGSVIWFIADWTGSVVRTGIEQGTEREVDARIRARYPEETSENVLAFSGVSFAGEEVVLWMLQDP